MTDYVICAPDAATLEALAQAMGFWDGEGIVTQGPLPGDDNPAASYFFNIVGPVEGETGYWSRLRINGLNPFASGHLTIPPEVTVYPPSTEDPAYVQPAVGVIA